MILFIVPFASWLYNQAADIATGVGDFLRSIPSYFAPKPTGLAAPFTPAFTGGQCAGIRYYINVSVTQPRVGRTATTENQIQFSVIGAVTNVQIAFNSGGSPSVFFTGKDTAGAVFNGSPAIPNLFTNEAFIVNSIALVRADGSTVECGNIPNPNPSPSISDDGLFKPTNTYITDSSDTVNESAIVLLPGLPLVLVPLISSAIAAALAAARSALDALEAVKKVAEALEGLAELWKKLKEFLDEWEKNRPKKRDITRQTYGQIEGDGALDFFAPNSKKVEAIQLDIVVTNIPVGFGKYFGSMSPSRYRYKELGYIAFYSVNQGILEVHSIQFKRTTLEIPKLAVGFIYHFGLDNQIKAFAFGTFSIEKT